MGEPYLIAGPAIISFSGGRSSGYLLWHILQAHGGALPPDVIVIFCNTGREMQETLDFIQECSERWNVSIVWLEFDPEAEHCTRTVNHNSASRSGEPFSALLDRKAMLPNPLLSFCTIELKLRRMREYCVHHLGWSRWKSIVGFRADEPRRVAKLPARNAARKDRWETIAPMAEAGATKLDILSWWNEQPFNLRLPIDAKGETVFGNCDGCFKKSRPRIASIFRERPDLAAWWIAQEDRHPDAGQNGVFRKDRPRYADLLRIAERERTSPPPMQTELFQDQEVDCACHD